MNKFYRKKKKLNIIIVILAICIIGMTIGYAIFSSQLQITGIVTGSSHFKVYFIDAWVTDPSKGTVTINTTEGSDRVKYNVTLNYPGDKCLVGTKIKNESSFRVKLNDFAITAINSTPDIIFDYIPLDTTNEKLDVNGICDYRFTIEWDANSTNTNPGPVTFEIGLEYEQDPEDPIQDPAPSHNHGEGEIYTARFNPNGGTVSQSAMQITYGKKYGEMPTPQRQEYTFLGWYTKLENGSLITKDTIVDTDKDITLYAIWNWDGHNISYIERVEPTCTEDGNIAHYKCLSCNKIYSDSAAENEITTSVKLEALGHDWDDGIETVESTCIQSGTILYTCKRDSSHTKTENSPVSSHNLTNIQRVEPTCTETGNIEYYKCSVCNNKFKDSEAVNEVSNVTLAATGHSLTTIAKVAATCTEDGYNAHYKCSKCTKLFKDASATVQTTLEQEKIAATGHNYVANTRIDDTYHGEKCSKCGDSKNKVKHTYSSSTSKYEESSSYYKTHHYYKCTVCTDQKMEKHSGSQVSQVGSSGHVTSYRCKCGVYYKDSTGVVSHGNWTYTYKTKTQHEKKCPTCGYAPYENHNTSNPCMADGAPVYNKVCSRCGYCSKHQKKH